ncbi:MAG: hypothetical protein IT287_07825 [Bdellovibrionaceae bacterium]|nr:hypothetical protein [Pseudobdellovibrionaceae bacterium]
MEYIKYFIFVGVVLLVLDQTALWIERKGWLYYRFKKPATAGLASALHSMNAFAGQAKVEVVSSAAHSEPIAAIKDDNQSLDL